MQPAPESQRNFIAYLEDLVRRQDRGALATLRRGLGQPPGLALAMHRYVVPLLPAGLTPREEVPYYLVAGLFAYWHQGRTTPASNPPRNLGLPWHGS